MIQSAPPASNPLSGKRRMIEHEMVRRFAGTARYEAGFGNDAYVGGPLAGDGRGFAWLSY